MNRKSPSTGSTSCLSLTDSSLGGEEFDGEGGYRIVALDMVCRLGKLSFEHPRSAHQQHQSLTRRGRDVQRTERGILPF